MWEWVVESHAVNAKAGETAHSTHVWKSALLSAIDWGYTFKETSCMNLNCWNYWELDWKAQSSTHWMQTEYIMWHKSSTSQDPLKNKNFDLAKLISIRVWYVHADQINFIS